MFPGRHQHSKITVETMSRWSDPAQESVLSYGDAQECFYLHSPRVQFLKTLPPRSEVLDVGAGDGSLVAFRRWPAPERLDLHMYAWGAEEGARFHEWNGFEVGLWPQAPPDFDGRLFDAVYCSNFIEHISDPKGFIGWAASRLKPGGSLFVEWPTPQSMKLPARDAFHAAGLPVITGRFDDDPTHQTRAPRRSTLAYAMQRAGLRVLRTGVSTVPFYDQQLAIGARREDDAVALTHAYWSFSGWLQYLSARKG